MDILIPNDPAPTLEDIWRLFRETDRKFQETDRKFQETDRKIQENAAQLKETERLFRKQMGELRQSIRRIC